MILSIRTKTYYSYPFLENGISSFYRSYSNKGDHPDDQQRLTESSYPITGSNYLQSQGSRLDSVIETEAEVSLKPPFI
jgi:hypothetical protein